MQAAIVVIFLALCISAPWISRKWGPRGEWAWGLTSITFLVAAVWVLSNV